MARRTEVPRNYLDPEVATGTVALPISKIKKTVKADDDVFQTNKQASFLLTIASEMFIQYLAEQGVKALAAERKARKTLQYKDLASAVSRIDNLEFLCDVIPPIVVTRQPRETKTAKSRKKPADDSKQTKLTLGRIAPVTVEGGAGEEGEKGSSPEEAEEGTQGAADKGKRREVEVEVPASSQDIEMGDS